MSKHYFHESKPLGTSPEYHRIIYCEWCGLVVWNFNTSDSTLKDLQIKVGKPCVYTPKECQS